MASETLVIKAEKRETNGSPEARRVRGKGWLPGVVSVENGDAQSIKVNRHDFEMFLKRNGSEGLIVDVDVEGVKTYKALLKDVQSGPVYGELVHVDFQEVTMTKRVRVPVGIRLIGSAEGVTSGGVQTQLIREVEVECQVKDLFDHIDLDVSSLEIDELRFVRDLKAPEGVRIVTNGDVVVVTVATSRLMRKAAGEDGEEGEGEEGAEGAEGAESEAEGGA